MKTTTAALCLLALCTFAAPADAARPFQTDDAGTVTPGTFETELSADYWSNKGAFGFSFKHGVTSRMDLGVSIGHTSWPEDEREYDNATLAFKYALVPELLSASFATKLGTSEYSLNGIVSHSFGDLGINANVGGDFTGGERSADLSWGVNPTYAVGPVILGAELRGNQHEAAWWQAGAQVKLADWIALDAGLGDDFSKNKNDWHAATGVWIAFPTSK
jgi:hypothetical protein